MLGLALGATGRSTEAIQQFEAALHINSDFAAARFNLANALVKAGRLDEAIADYREVIQAFPNDPLPKTKLAEALEQKAKTVR